MTTNFSTSNWKLGLGLAAIAAWAAIQGVAQEGRERGRPLIEAPENANRGQFRDERSDPAPQREGGIPRGQIAPQREGDDQGTEEGMPQMRPGAGRDRIAPPILPPERRRWRLGVFGYNTDSGVVITRVVPGSAANENGLEPGDRIIAVRGYQVGWVDDHLYPLGSELQRHAGGRGNVVLLVQNIRNRRLQNLHVQLDRFVDGGPRLPPGRPRFDDPGSRPDPNDRRTERPDRPRLY